MLQILPFGAIGTSIKNDTMLTGSLMGKANYNNGHINGTGNPSIVNQLAGFSNDTNNNINNNNNNLKNATS